MRYRTRESRSSGGVRGWRRGHGDAAVEESEEGAWGTVLLPLHPMRSCCLCLLQWAARLRLAIVAASLHHRRDHRRVQRIDGVEVEVEVGWSWGMGL
jgi:hypothetical protein